VGEILHLLYQAANQKAENKAIKMKVRVMLDAEDTSVAPVVSSQFPWMNCA
jgi:hypothetical protein